MITMGDVCCLDKQVQENGLDGYKMVQESESTNRYLHKKFKKVATLEESGPKRGKGVLYSVPPEEPEQPKSVSPDGRYVCPYCKVCVSKPSVLQKHIRAHTNERPYPCLPCGFAFKTKSNLYKHRRSRAHSLKTDGLSSEDDDGGSPSSEMSNKPYKPKFHLTETSLSSAASTCSSPFSSSPSPDLLNAQINHLITENPAMLFDMDGPSILRRDTPSPLRNGESNAALRLSSYPVHSMPTLEPEDLSSTSTSSSEPLNLTVKEPRKRGLADVYSNSLLLPSPSKESFVLRHREIPDLTRITEEVLYPCPNCKVVFRTHDNLKTHLFSCKPKSSPGPLLGKTPLVDTYDGDSVKKRKLDLNRLNSAKKCSLKLFGGGAVQVLDNSPENCKIQRLDVNKEIARKDAQVLMFAKTGLNVVGATIVQSNTPEVQSPSYSEKLVLPIISNVSPPLLKVPGISTPVQFPPLRFPPSMNPLTQITAYNPLTLPTLSPVKSSTQPQGPLASPYNGGVGTIMLAGKEIPFVPGMPGPQTLLGSSPPLPVPSHVQLQKQEKSVIIRSPVPSISHTKTDTPKPPPPPRAPSPVKAESPEPEPAVKQLSDSKDDAKSASEGQERKFLRPSSLPLKPGTYMPKKQLAAPFHTTSLISPETPRPRKSYGQLYLNGHAYTYLGLKCSTRMFFCTLNKPQPIYVPLAPDQYKVSMYSNWTICSDASPSPPGLDSRKTMSCYDSRNRNCSFTSANRNKQDLVTHSSYKSTPPEADQSPNSGSATSKSEGNGGSDKLPICEGGFESNEEYTYVRGRDSSCTGRGRYVCKECGIRCKKPSMLKKHIRTHTDLRPYTCKYCAFSFKTKGNLTKHMKSKAHYKRCVELDINPVPTNIDSCYLDDETSSQQSGPITPAGVDEESEETEEDEDDEDDESEDDAEDGDDCRMEREAAKSLLSLSEVTLEIAHRQYVSAGLVSSLNSKPRSYPYAFISPQIEPASIEKQAKADAWRSDVLSLNKDCQDLAISVRLSPRSEPSESTRPMDLSNKSLGLYTRAALKTPVITSASSQPLLMASVCSTTEKLPSTPIVEHSDDGALLHAYLTERTIRDQHIKVQLNRKRDLEPVERVSDSDSSQLHQPMEEEENLVEEPTPKEQALAPKTNTPPASVPPAVSPAVPAASPAPAVSAAQHKRPESPPCQLLLASPGNKKKAEFKEPASALSYISSTEDGKSMCSVCNKVFNKPSQLRLHVNIHYFERPFRCESCAVSFRTKGHLQKHLRSLSHLNKMNMNSTFGTATTSNPRPFKCDDCKIAFRIHGHLAKHFRSKMHIMKLECLGKLPFGMYAELERSGINMSDIDTTDCENSLESLQLLAQKLSLDKPGTPRPDHWEALEQQQRGGVSGSDMFGGGSASEDESSYSNDNFGRPCDIETRNESVR